MILRNHYETLGINKGATDEDVRKAYHRLARIYHPDKNDDPKTEEKFKEIGQAYEIMKNKDSRQIWEREFARQTQNFRDQRSHSAKQSPKKEAKSSSSTSKSSPTKETKENTKPDPKTSGKYKYKFFFTDSDYENENEENEKMRKRQSNRSQSYAGTEKSRFRETDFTFQFPDPDDDFKSREKNKNKWNNNFADNNNTNRGSSFGFNIYMDSDNGFQSFFDPFHMFYEWQDKTFQYRDFDEDDAEEFLANFKEEYKEKKSKAKECAGNEGESDWYDWTRVFQPYDSEDDEIENENDRLTCTYCRKQMTPELLRKHEPRCRRFSGGPDILAYRHKQAQLHSTQDRRRRTSLQQDAKANVSKDELITCMYCYRKFNQKVADRHIEFCERQTHQTGRPMNPLGKSAAARDYSSKNFTAKEYAKTVPKPGTKPPSSKRRQSPHSSDPERGDSVHTNNNNDINNGSQTTSSPDVNKNKPFRRRTSKPKLIDINILPPNTKFSTTSSAADSFPGEGCATCQRSYGTTVSRFTCSCGVRKSFSSTTANT